jgi:hypothetical protein
MYSGRLTRVTHRSVLHCTMATVSQSLAFSALPLIAELPPGQTMACTWPQSAALIEATAAATACTIIPPAVPPAVQRQPGLPPAPCVPLDVHAPAAAAVWLPLPLLG